MEMMLQNAELARTRRRPVCQDTGTVIFHVHCPPGFDQTLFEHAAKTAVMQATRLGFLRENSVDPITGKNAELNVGPGTPVFEFVQVRELSHLEVRLLLKGGGSENVSCQYALPEPGLGAHRDLDGCKRVVLDAVLRAQGRGCAPGVLGVCIGGDRGTGYRLAKTQLFRRLDDKNPDPHLQEFERELVGMANELGIGPMGYGGRTTLLGVKTCTANRVPASYFVTVSYMCWAFRRQGIAIAADGVPFKWLYE